MPTLSRPGAKEGLFMTIMDTTRWKKGVEAAERKKHKLTLGTGLRTMFAGHPLTGSWRHNLLKIPQLTRRRLHPALKGMGKGREGRRPVSLHHLRQKVDEEGEMAPRTATSSSAACWFLFRPSRTRVVFTRAEILEHSPAPIIDQ